MAFKRDSVIAGATCRGDAKLGLVAITETAFGSHHAHVVKQMGYYDHLVHLPALNETPFFCCIIILSFNIT